MGVADKILLTGWNYGKYIALSAILLWGNPMVISVSPPWAILCRKDISVLKLCPDDARNEGFSTLGIDTALYKSTTL